MAKRTLSNAILGIVAALMLVGGTPAQAREGKSDEARAGQAEQKAGQLSKADRTFIKKAAQAHLAEINLGKLAEEKAQRDSVKQLAREMIESHSNARDRLAKIAEDKDLTLPEGVSKADQKVYDRLAKLEGERFDREYLQVMQQAHTRAERLFRNEVKRGRDPDVTAYAQQLLPTLQMHKRMAAAARRTRTM